MGLRSHDYVNDNAFGSAFTHFFGRMCVRIMRHVRVYAPLVKLWVADPTEYIKPLKEQKIN